MHGVEAGRTAGYALARKIGSNPTRESKPEPAAVGASTAAMPEALRSALASRVATAYRALFFVLAAIAALGIAIASTNPKTQWKS